MKYYHQQKISVAKVALRATEKTLEENKEKSTPITDQERQTLHCKIKEAEESIIKIRDEQSTYINELKKKIVNYDTEIRAVKERETNLKSANQQLNEVNDISRNY